MIINLSIMSVEDKYILLGVELDVFTELLEVFVLPKFRDKGVTELRAIEKDYRSTNRVWGTQYVEYVMIYTNIDFYIPQFDYGKLFDEIDLVFKLLCLRPADYLMRYGNECNKKDLVVKK